MHVRLIAPIPGQEGNSRASSQAVLGAILVVTNKPLMAVTSLEESCRTEAQKRLASSQWSFSSGLAHIPSAQAVSALPCLAGNSFLPAPGCDGGKSIKRRGGTWRNIRHLDTWLPGKPERAKFVQSSRSQHFVNTTEKVEGGGVGFACTMLGCES